MRLVCNGEFVVCFGVMFLFLCLILLYELFNYGCFVVVVIIFFFYDVVEGEGWLFNFVVILEFLFFVDFCFLLMKVRKLKGLWINVEMVKLWFSKWCYFFEDL